MGAEWTEKTLADISTDISYGYTESANSDPVGPHFLRITDIQGGFVDWKSVPYCPISEDNKDKYILKKGDIVVARTGKSTGENFIFDCNEESVYASYLIRFRIDPYEAVPRYVWYSMRAPSWWAFIDGVKTGSAQAGANARVLGGFQIRLPPLPEQRAIAHVLGSFDDKIKNNHRMNQTLEEMARSIFQSWFVDFDPVRAKMEGRQPEGMDAETAALFPDRLVEDPELGEIPDGWNSGEIRNFLDHFRTGVSPKENPEELFAHYSIPAFDSEGMPKKELGQDIRSNKYEISSETVLISKLNPDIPRAWLPFPEKGLRSICSTEFLDLRPKEPFTREYLYSLFQSPSFQSRFVSLVGGTSKSHQRVKPQSLLGMPALIPPPEVIKEFTRKISPILDLVGENLLENQTLAELRDTLLPKLMSGEIRVPEAEKLAEEAT